MTHRSVSAILATFHKELRLLIRDPFCVAMLVCFSMGLAWTSWNTHKEWHDFSVQQVERLAAAREAWLSQETTSAHMATHVGQTVYKPVSPLAGFDPGEVANFGSHIFLESHRQSVAKGRPRRDQLDLLQNEVYSPAVLFEFIGPLLVVLLSCASVAREKEGGTLSMLLTTGTSWKAIVIGKGFAVLLALFIVSLPGLLLLLVPWFEHNPAMNPSDLLVRQLLILVFLFAYYVGWFGLATWVSAKSNSTMGSFSLLIALWSVFALVMPRIAGDLAAFTFPLPTNAEILIAKENAVKNTNQSSLKMAKANEALERRLLEEFKVDRIEDLPIDIAGARMIDHEAMANRLYDEVEAQVAQAKSRQNELMSRFQFASPFLAMRTVSTNLAASGRSHHVDFLNSAEEYRRQYVELLNRAEMKKEKPGSTRQQRRQFWSRVPEFVPAFVLAMEDVKRSFAAICCIVSWAIFMVIASLFSSPQISRLR